MLGVGDDATLLTRPIVPRRRRPLPCPRTRPDREPGHETGTNSEVTGSLPVYPLPSLGIVSS